MVISERGGWGRFGAGDKTVEVSERSAIVHNHLGVGGKVCSLTINCVAHNL